MGDKTRIEWCDATWNPVTGCTKVSSGCKNCYADREFNRMRHLPAYKGRAFTDVAFHPDRLFQPMRLAKPRRIFVNSMSDLFHPDVPDKFLDQVFSVMALCPRHVFQVLTKRPERMLDFMSRIGVSTETLYEAESIERCPFERDGKYLVSLPLPNVWLGVSVEDQATADERIPILLRTAAAVRWVSAEPLLGRIDLTRIQWPGNQQVNVLTSVWHPGFTNHIDMARLDWIVVGGESGPRARPMHPQWVRSLRDQCASSGVPFLFKQWGEFVSVSEIDGRGPHYRFDDGATVRRVGKRAAGRTLDGVMHDEYPRG